MSPNYSLFLNKSKRCWCLLIFFKKIFLHLCALLLFFHVVIVYLYIQVSIAIWISISQSNSFFFQSLPLFELISNWSIQILAIASKCGIYFDWNKICNLIGSRAEALNNNLALTTNTYNINRWQTKQRTAWKWIDNGIKQRLKSKWTIKLIAANESARISKLSLIFDAIQYRAVWKFVHLFCKLFRCLFFSFKNGSKCKMDRNSHRLNFVIIRVDLNWKAEQWVIYLW